MPALKPLAAIAATALAGMPDDRDVLVLLNDVRRDPAGYAERLERAAEGYDGRDYRESDGTAHGSFEGPDAVREAARALAATPAPPALRLDPVLAAAARAHGEAQGRTGGIGHASAAGASPGERARRAGGDIYVVEAISYGMRTPEGVVRQLLVDDGVRGRGHRRTLLNGYYRHAGIWCGPHAGRGTSCVIDLAATPGGRAIVPPER